MLKYKKQKSHCATRGILFWSARQELNPQSLESESNALSSYATGRYKSVVSKDTTLLFCFVLDRFKKIWKSGNCAAESPENLAKSDKA